MDCYSRMWEEEEEAFSRFQEEREPRKGRGIEYVRRRRRGYTYSYCVCVVSPSEIIEGKPKEKEDRRQETFLLLFEVVGGLFFWR